jgi:putative transposase
MARFTSAKSCQMFVSIPAWIHNHFNLERQLYNGEQFKSNRAAALNEWRQRAR